MAVFVKPFDRLLNTINHELDEQNLRSLIHICGYYIRGRDREKIKDGLDLFRILRQCGVLSEDRDKIGNLLEIIKEMRPKRQDLVNEVTEFIRNTVEAPDKILVIGSESLEASGDCLRLVRESRCDTPILVSSVESRLCSMNCCCWSCNCYSRKCPPCVCVILAVASLFMAAIAAIAWFGDIPLVANYLNEDKDRQNAGKYAVGLLGFTGLVFGIVAFVKCKVDKTNRYSAFDQSDLASPSRRHSFSSGGSFHSFAKSTVNSRKYRREGSKASSYASNSTMSGPIFQPAVPIANSHGHSFGAQNGTSKLPDDVVPDSVHGGDVSLCSYNSEIEFMFPGDPKAVENLSTENLTEPQVN